MLFRNDLDPAVSSTNAVQRNNALLITRVGARAHAHTRTPAPAYDSKCGTNNECDRVGCVGSSSRSLYGFRDQLSNEPVHAPASPANRPPIRSPLTSSERQIWDERVAICMINANLRQAEAEQIAWQQIEEMRGTKQTLAAAHQTAELKPGRCIDCRRFRREGSTLYCLAGIGGTLVRWSDGHQECSPQPDAWHHCVSYLERGTGAGA